MEVGNSEIVNRMLYYCDDEFCLSANSLKRINGYVFSDVYTNAGDFRDYNLSKKEKVLEGDTVKYSNYSMIDTTLNYDLERQKSVDYNKMSSKSIVSDITDFNSRLWQVHPFGDGNTRSTMVFLVEYLKKCKIEVDLKLFLDNMQYYRNALVRANYYNRDINVIYDQSYLEKIYENILLDKNNILDNEELVLRRR